MPTSSSSRIIAISRQQSPERRAKSPTARPKSPTARPRAPLPVVPAATSIPEHLRYKQPVVPQPFGYVESRYKSPPKRVDPNTFYNQQMAASAPKPIPQNTAYAGVISRYRSPPKERPPEPPKPLQRTESVASAEYYALKRSAAAHGLGNVQSRLMEATHRANSPTHTRREEVEKKVETLHRNVNKNGKPWAMRACSGPTFDAQRKHNEELKRWESPPKRKDPRPSVIMQYIAGSINLAPQPEQREKSEEPRMDGQLFLGGGGPVVRTKSPNRQAYQMEEDKVKNITQKLKTARTASPPRVASIIRPAERRSLEEKTASMKNLPSSGRTITTTKVASTSSLRARTPPASASSTVGRRSTTPSTTTSTVRRTASPPPRHGSVRSTTQRSSTTTTADNASTADTDPVIVVFNKAVDSIGGTTYDDDGTSNVSSATPASVDKKAAPPLIFRNREAPRLR